MNVVIAFGAIGATVGVIEYAMLGYDDLGHRPKSTLSHYMTYSGLLMLVACAAASRLIFYSRERLWPAIAMPALLVALVVAGIALLAVAAGVVQLAAGMLLAGLGIAPAIACLYLLVDRLAPTGTVTEAFTWVTTAFATGFAAGNALGGSLVHRVGTDRAFLVAAGGVAAAALLARLRRPTLAARSAGMREAAEGLGRAG
jgi:predicted MFS family arabinose efflux permease